MLHVMSALQNNKKLDFIVNNSKKNIPMSISAKICFKIIEQRPH